MNNMVEECLNPDQKDVAECAFALLDLLQPLGRLEELSVTTLSWYLAQVLGREIDALVSKATFKLPHVNRLYVANSCLSLVSMCPTVSNLRVAVAHFTETVYWPSASQVTTLEIAAKHNPMDLAKIQTL